MPVNIPTSRHKSDRQFKITIIIRSFSCSFVSLTFTIYVQSVLTPNQKLIMWNELSYIYTFFSFVHSSIHSLRSSTLCICQMEKNFYIYICTYIEKDEYRARTIFSLISLVRSSLFYHRRKTKGQIGNGYNDKLSTVQADVHMKSLPEKWNKKNVLYYKIIMKKLLYIYVLEISNKHITLIFFFFFLHLCIKSE